MSAIRGRLSLFLRLFVSVGIVALLLSRLDPESMLTFLLGADPGLVALTLVAVIADRVLMATRWIQLLEALEVAAQRARIVKIFFLSTFFGSFLPSGVGGEAVRAVSLSKLTSRTTEAVASVIANQMADGQPAPEIRMGLIGTGGMGGGHLGSIMGLAA